MMLHCLLCCCSSISDAYANGGGNGGMAIYVLAVVVHAPLLVSMIRVTAYR